MAEIKTINYIPLADTTARENITTINENISKLSDEIDDLKLSSDIVFESVTVGEVMTSTTEEPNEPEEPDTPIEPDVTLTSISVNYNGGEVTVGTALTSLRGITVTATYSDGSTANVTDYTLSGSIVEGNNTITVAYEGMTTTFIVVGVAESSGGDNEEDTGLTDEELAQLEAMPDAYLSDDGEYLYINPLSANSNIFKFGTAGTLSVNINNELSPTNFKHLDYTGESIYKDIIPYAKNTGSESGQWTMVNFRENTTIPSLCYGFSNTGMLLMRTDIDAYNNYVDKGGADQYLYDKFRRLPIKTSSLMAVLEITDEIIDSLSGTPSTTPNEQGFYTGFLITSLGNGLGVLPSRYTFCSYGGYVNGSGAGITRNVEYYRCSESSTRFYYSIPQDAITDLTLDGYKAFLKGRGIKIFYPKAEETV